MTISDRSSRLPARGTNPFTALNYPAPLARFSPRRLFPDWIGPAVVFCGIGLAYFLSHSLLALTTGDDVAAELGTMLERPGQTYKLWRLSAGQEIAAAAKLGSPGPLEFYAHQTRCLLRVLSPRRRKKKSAYRRTSRRMTGIASLRATQKAFERLQDTADHNGPTRKEREPEAHEAEHDRDSVVWLQTLGGPLAVDAVLAAEHLNDRRFARRRVSGGMVGHEEASLARWGTGGPARVSGLADSGHGAPVEAFRYVTSC